MDKAGIFLMILAAAAVCAQAQTKKAADATQKPDIKAKLEANGFKLAAALVDIANLTNPLGNPAAVYTILVPDDAAVQAFLKEMGLTVDDLKARPALAQELLAAHIILKANVRPQELFANGSTRIVSTVAGKPNNLRFTKLKDGSIKVTDVQGNEANVKKEISLDENKTILPVDRVILSDAVFPSFAALCKFRALTLSEFCNAVHYADLNAAISAKDFKNTVFVPNNKAFAKRLQLNGGVVPSVERTAEVLKFHVVPGIHSLPKGFKDGQSVETLLKGQNLTVTYEIVKPKAGDTWLWPYAKAIVATPAGTKAEVVKANVFVGPAVVHGIEEILLPAETTAAAKPATKSAAATKPAAPAAKPAGRRLLSAVTAFSSSTGRSLLDFGWGMSGGPTAEMDAAAGAINAAASGYVSPAFASQESLSGAEDLSVPGAYNLVDEGVTPW